MKTLPLWLLLSLLAFPCLSSAQVHRNLGDFSEIRVADRITLHLVPADENQLEITGDEADNVIVNNRQGSLRIRMKTTRFMRGEQTKATLYYKRIDKLTAANGALITADQELEATALALTANKGGAIDLGIQTKTLNVKATSGATIELSGNTDHLQADINSGGSIESRDLTAKNATVSISAGGEMEIRVLDAVEAQVNLGGNIYIYGNPEITEKITAGGKVHRMN